MDREQDVYTHQLAERLAAISWSELTHAYGPADDLPARLQDLVSDDDKSWRTALDSFWGSICHQGTVYEASVAAVPFLTDILPHVPDERRAGILRVLAGLANRDIYADRSRKQLIYRVKIDAPEFDDGYELWSNERFLREGSPYQDPRWMNLGHERARDGISTYLVLLHSGQPECQIAAMYLLSGFAEERERIVPEILDLLDVTIDPSVQAAALIALGPLLEEHSREWDRVTAACVAGEGPLVRLCGALSLASYHPTSMTPVVAELLVEAMVSPEPLEASYRALEWASYWEPLHAQAAEALGCLGNPDGVNALLTALRQGAGIWRMTDTVRVAETLLDVVFFGQPVTGRYWQTQSTYQLAPDGGILAIGESFDVPSYYEYGHSFGREWARAPIACTGYDEKAAKRLAQLFESERAGALTDGQREALIAVLQCEPIWRVEHNLLAIYGLPEARKKAGLLLDISWQG